MEEKEFRDTLPGMTFCDRCGAVLTNIAWQVARFDRAEWFAIGIVKCESCSWVRVAAAGSHEASHKYAREARQEFMKSMGLDG